MIRHIFVAITNIGILSLIGWLAWLFYNGGSGWLVVVMVLLLLLIAVPSRVKGGEK